MYEQIKYEVDGPSAIITLNRPEALNALTGVMLDEIKHALAQAERDEAVLGVLLTGEGRGFCAGMDMNALDSQASGGAAGGGTRQALAADPGDKAMGRNFQVTFSYILSIRKPIIAVVNGACAGLGMAIALLCDLRFGSENARFVTSFSQRGLVAEHGMSWLLPRLLGQAKALDLLWTSRKVGAEEALAMGLLDRQLPQDGLLAGAKQYLADLAASAAPSSLKLMKQQVYRHLNMQLGEAMQETNELMAASLKRPDFKEGVRSFMEKRPPAFAKLKVP